MNQEDQSYVSGGLSGAASGAALGTSIAPGWGTLIGGVVGAGLGLYGAYTQNEADSGRPAYQIPKEIYQNLNQAQQQALQGLPEEQKAQFIKNMQRQTSYGLGQAKSRKAGLIGVAAMNQQNNDALEGMAVADAQSRDAKTSALYGARNTMADYKGQEFQINKENPYYEGVAKSSGQRAANLDSINNAANTIGSIYAKGGYNTGGNNSMSNQGGESNQMNYLGGNNQVGDNYNPDGTLTA